LVKITGCPVGLSDHTLGTVVSTAAVALGACLIEKHFTLSRADKGPDCEFSLEPAEMKQLVQDTKDAWRALGSPTMERQAVEKGNLQFRRSLYFVKDKVAGSIIGPEDVRRIRPGFGLAPKFYQQILGRKLNRDIRFGEPVRLEDFE
jgi:N-acetylneuraminate synthase